MKIEYSPRLFLPTKKQSKWKTLFDENLEPIEFSTMREARDFTRQYEGVEGFRIFGNTSFQYTYIAENNPQEIIEWGIEDLIIGNIDIEVGSDNGFPEPSSALEPITAITIKLSSTEKYYVFGTGEYLPHRDDVEYIRCKDEFTLIKHFLAFWRENTPDLLTGWNTKFFDVPYMVNRFTKVVGEQEMRSLSPWNLVNSRSVNRGMGKEETTYEWLGVGMLDYLEMYKWYAPEGKSQESYRLDNIASVELGMNKLSYEEYDSLHQFLSTKSKNIVIDVNRKVEDMKDFEKWCFLRDKIKKELSGR